MPWFKVDDTLALHGKVVAAGNPAMGLWVRAGHNAYQRGERDEDTQLKERIYQRNRGPRKTSRKVAA